MEFNKKIYYCKKCGKIEIIGESLIHICDSTPSKKENIDDKTNKEFLVIPKVDIKVNGS